MIKRPQKYKYNRASLNVVDRFYDFKQDNVYKKKKNNFTIG